MSVRTYRKYTCVNCKKQAKQVTVVDRMKLGNPLFKCPHCGATNYDQFIFEPALLDPQELIKDAKKQYNNGSIYCMLAVLAFFVLMLATSSPIIGAAAAGILLIVLFSNSHKKKNSITIDHFSKEINESLARLNADRDYANLIIRLQKNHPDSAWSKQGK